MANIKDIYEDAERTTPFYPRTHTKAVVDDNGNTVENKLGFMENLINQKQYAVGAIQYDSAPTEGSSNYVTSDGIRSTLIPIKKSLATATITKESEDVTSSGSYIKTSDSTSATSNNMTTWKITNDGYVRIKAYVKNTDANAYAVSFFKSSTINASNKIAGYAFSGTTWDSFDLVIPDNTVLICVTTRNSSIAATPFTIYNVNDLAVQGIADRVTTLETQKAIIPFDMPDFVGGRGYNNSGNWDAYSNLIGDPDKYALSDFLINGELCIVCNYIGENQVKCKIPFYNSSGSHVGYNAWTVLSQGENWFTPKTNSVYFSICLGMNDSGGTEINASNKALYNGLYYKVANTISQQVTASAEDIQNLDYRLDVIDNGGNTLTQTKPTSNGLSYTYLGKKLEFGNKYSRVDVAIATGGNQAGAVYGDLLFTFNADRKNCYIIDMNTRNIVQNISMTQISDFHCNQVNFGTAKYDPSDQFPLLYVDGLYTKTCQVFRITVEEEVYSLTLVQTITYPSEYYHPEAFIDKDTNTLWVAWEYGGAPSSGSYNGTIRLQKFAMPTLSQGDVTLSASNSTEYIDVTGVPIMQGGSIIDGKAYIATGYTGYGRLYVVDLYCSKQKETMMHIGNEPQTFFLWKNALWALSSAKLFRFYLW